MSKQHVLDIIQTAQGRAAAIHATVPGFAFNAALSVEGYHASIDAARDEVFQYIALQSQLNAQRSRMLAAGRALAERSNRMLCAVHSTFGKDSHPYQAVAAVKSSAPRRRPRRRRGIAVASGRRAAESMPDRSTAQEPVRQFHPVANEGLVGRDLVDVGQKEDAGAESQGAPGDNADALRRIEVLAPREIQEGDASPADEVERGEEIDGAEEVGEEEVAAPQPQAVAIDAANAGRACAEALAVPEPLHEDTPEPGNDQEADSNQGRPHVVKIAGDEGEQEGEEGGHAHRDGDVHRIGGRAPWRGCGREGVRRLETRKRASKAVPVPWTIPKAILKE